MALNVAQVCPETYTLGPGKRFAIWVQGCPLRCKECIAPDWIPRKTANVISIGELAARIWAVPGLEGITLSGGEPMLQASELARLIYLVRSEKPDLSVIVFSGFTLAQLYASRLEGVGELLSEVDVLIDGPYETNLNDGIGLRGSANQEIHFLTKRYRDFISEFQQFPRSVELHVLSDSMLVVGMPPKRVFAGWRNVVDVIVNK